MNRIIRIIIILLLGASDVPSGAGNHFPSVSQSFSQSVVIPSSKLNVDSIQFNDGLITAGNIDRFGNDGEQSISSSSKVG